MPFSVYLFIRYFVYCRRQKNIAKSLRAVPIYRISEQICFGYHLLMFKFTLCWLAAHLWESAFVIYQIFCLLPQAKVYRKNSAHLWEPACGANYGGAADPSNRHLENGENDNAGDTMPAMASTTMEQWRWKRLGNNYDIDNESGYDKGNDGNNDRQTRDQMENLRKLNIEIGNYNVTATTKDQMEPFRVICRAGLRKGSRRGSTVWKFESLEFVIFWYSKRRYVIWF